MTRILRPGLMLGIALCGLALGAAEPRTWTDSTGKITIRAKLISSEKGKVTLEKLDGKRVEIDLNKLSRDDQKFLLRMPTAEEDPFKPVEPFKPVMPDAEKVKPIADVEMTTPDHAAAVIVSLVPTNAQWKFAGGAAPNADVVPSRVLPLPQKASHFEKVTGADVSLAAGKLAVGYAWDDRAKPDGGTTRVVVSELAGGKRPVVASVPGTYELIGLTGTGDKLLMKKADLGPGKSDSLELWIAAADGVKKLAKWEPYNDINAQNRSIRWAAMLEGKRAVTCNPGGKIVVWDLDPIAPKFVLQAHAGVVPGLSADQKFLAFATDKELGILDLVKGEVVCARPLQGGPLPWPQLSFSPSGKKLGCLSTTKLFVYDAASGQFEREVVSPTVMKPGEMAWASDELFLAARQTLIDVTTGLQVWNYLGIEALASAGGQFWLIASASDRDAGAAIPTKLPQPAAVAAMEKARNDPTFFALKPGSVLKLDVSGVEDESKRDEVTKSLTSQAEKAGFKIGEDGTVTLSASTAKGKVETLVVTSGGGGPFGMPRPPFGGPFGPPGGRGKGTEYKVQEYNSRLSIKSGGKELWQYSLGSIPNGYSPFGNTIERRQDQTVADYIKENYEKPNYSVFSRVELPKLLTRDANRATLGSSHLSPSGLR